jgi:hypothetical protein
MRALSEEFVRDLKNPDGLLHPILKRVKEDDTLMLAIRTNYINIYYRGGNILEIIKQRGSYKTSFDNKYDRYNKYETPISLTIRLKSDAEKLVKEFSLRKEIMDIFFASKNKSEREFQQLVARENNYSTISKKSEYFITDIEFNDKELGARLDMLAIRWLASDRRDGSGSRAALIEMKYGDDALDGKSGLLEHLEDMEKLISNRNKYKSLLETMESQFNQLDELELFKFSHNQKGTKVKLDVNNKPEVIIILANHNPRGRTLKILENPKFIEWAETNLFDLGFFVSCFAGYGLHSDCIFTLSDFRELLKTFNSKQNTTAYNNAD